VMSYSNAHETSNLRTYAFRGGARGSGGRVALLRCLRPRRCQILLASARRERPPRIAENLGCGSQTVRNAIHAFNERGLGALRAGSSRPREVHAAFDQSGSEALREMLHHDPRKYGKRSSLWTLRMAAEVSFEEGITQRPVSGETIRATLARLGVRWRRAKRWMESPDPEYARKKGIEIG
jgi:transposase